MADTTDVAELRKNFEEKELAMQTELDAYIDSSKELENELESELEKAEEKLSISEIKNEEQSSTIDSLKSEQARLRSDLSKAETRCTALISKVNDSKKSLQEFEQKQDDLENSLRAAQASEENLQVEVESMMEEAAFNATELEDAKRELSEAQGKTFSQISELQGDLDAVRSKLTDAIEKSKIAADENTRLEEELENAKVAAETQGGNSETLQEELQTLVSAKYQLQIQLDDTMASNELLETQLANLQTQVDEAVNSNELLESRLEKASSEISFLKADHEDTLNSLRAEIDEAKELASSNQEATKFSDAQLMKGIEQQLEECKSALSNMTLEATEKEHLESELRTEISKLQQEEEILKKGVEDSNTYQDVVSKLKTEISGLKEKVAMGGGDGSPFSSPVRTIQELPPNPPSPAFSPVATLARSIINPLAPPLSSTSVHDMVSNAILSNDPDTLAAALKQILEKYDGQTTANATLLQKVQSIQHNIQVCCRIRRLTAKEIKAGEKVVIEPLSPSECGYFDKKSETWKSFAFDKVFGPDQGQQEIFEEVEPLCLSVVDGFNACIFAYGQTGSGKTWTMEGSGIGNQFGISYRTLHKVFELLR